MDTKTSPSILPVLRWAGGKRWLWQKYPELFPKDINNYFEPFLGGAAIFYKLKSENTIIGNCYLNDVNADLINFYECLKYDAKLFCSTVSKWDNNEQTYYTLRQASPNSKMEQACIFYYLNRYSFNGIYRVNQKGEYNVPYGNKTYADLVPIEELHLASSAIQKVNFSNLDFSHILHKSNPGDFVFIDPPYTVAHNNNGFIKYNQKIFSWDDQIKLRDMVRELADRDVRFVVTNADHESINNLYLGIGRKQIVSRFSVVGGKFANRKKYTELVITND